MKVKEILNLLAKFLVVLILASLLLGSIGFAVYHYGWNTIVRIFIWGLIFVIGLIFVAIVAGLIYTFRDAVGTSIVRELGYLIGTNNGRVVLVFLGMLLALGIELYQMNRVISPYMSQSPVKETVSIKLSGRSETEQSLYGFFDGNQEVVERIAKPKSLKSTWWFVRQTIIIIGLLLIGLIYFPISRIDEVKEAIRRVKQRLDEASGGVLEAEKPGFFSRFKEWHQLKKVPLVPVGAPVLAIAGAPAATIAAPVAGAPGAIAQTVMAIPQKVGFLKKHAPWFAFAALFIEELFEVGPILRKRK